MSMRPSLSRELVKTWSIRVKSSSSSQGAFIDFLNPCKIPYSLLIVVFEWYTHISNSPRKCVQKAILFWSFVADFYYPLTLVFYACRKRLYNFHAYVSFIWE